MGAGAGGADADPAGDRTRWFTVGPTALHPLVPDAAGRALAAGLGSWSHRSAPARAEVARTVEALRALLEIPPGHRVLFLGSATEAMERVVEGAVERRSFHLVNGAFARRFRDIARNLGREPEALEVVDGAGFDLEGVNLPGEAELVALTQNETSTGVALAPAGIGELARRHPGVLVAVDAVTAAPIQPLELPLVDAAFFSVQKLFGLPAGLGVLIVSERLVERARERQGRGGTVGGYLHIPGLARAADAHETAATPNLLFIHLLGRVAEAYLERGIDTLRRENREMAARVDAAARRAGWVPFPPRSGDRSTTVLVYEVPGGSGPVRARLKERGIQVSSGYGPHRDRHLRVACFPAWGMAEVEALVEGIEGVG